MLKADHVKQSDDGATYAGDHLLLDFSGAQNLTDIDVIRDALESSAAAAGATIVHSHCHRFGDSGGITGVTVLAESHITIHTWPEHNYAAIDIFMCGKCDPNDCIETLESAFKPQRIIERLVQRGQDIGDVRAVA